MNQLYIEPACIEYIQACLRAYMIVCVCVFFLLLTYICTAVCMAVRALSCQCDPGLIPPLVLIPEEGEL